MAYTREQRRIIARIKSIGRQVGASPKEIKAALETGRVEANFTNPSAMTDHDSQGWRQERASLYKDPTNLDASIRRFYHETRAVKAGYGTAGALAAAVQRPAAQYRGRYQQHSSEADKLLGMPTRGGGGGSGSHNAPARQFGGGTARVGGSTRTTIETTPGVDNSAARASLVQSFLEDEGSDVLDFAMQARNLRDIAPTSTRRTVRTPGRLVRVAGAGGGSTASSARRGAPRAGTTRAGLARGGEGKVIGTPYSGTHNLGNWQSDNAIDEALPTGTILQVPRNAVVEKVRGGYHGGSSRFDGYQVTVRLADGNRLFYTHLSKTHVKPGQRLRAGQAIGRSGAANSVQHLHLGAERGDPRKYLGRA